MTQKGGMCCEKKRSLILFDKYDGEPSVITWLDDHTAVINGIRLYVPLMIVGGYVVDALTIMHTWGVLL